MDLVSRDEPRSASPVRLSGTPVVALWTGRQHGDQRPVIEGHAKPPEVVPADARIAGLRQVHGGEVVVVGREPDAVLSGTDLSGTDLSGTRGGELPGGARVVAKA